MKLNQLIALEKGLKSRVTEKITAAYHNLKKGELFTGFTKTYTPKDDDPNSALGEKFPDESKKVQFDVAKLLSDVASAQTELMDVTFSRDVANCSAAADVVVDGVVICEKAPLTFLLWLEKQLHDLHTEVKSIPTLDAADRWTLDNNQGFYVTDPIKTNRTKKVQQPLVLYQATDKHPAQVQLITEDVQAGTWSTTKHSAAMPVPRKEQLLARVEKLQQAVRQAREGANVLEVGSVSGPGKKIFDFVLAP